MDWIGWIIGIVGILVGVAGVAYAVFVERRAKQRRDIAHAGLVALKSAIQGDNRNDVIPAINDLLEKLGKSN
jgi:hypothetical protein